MPKYGIKNFIKIANEYVNGETSTISELEKRLIGWFCFKFNTTPNDARLEAMTLEELVIFYQMHNIKENPQIALELDPSYKDYETWLAQEMGENYKSPEQMQKDAIKLEEEEQKWLEENQDKFPPVIKTDFSKIGKE